jgi:hypothetical protein
MRPARLVHAARALIAASALALTAACSDGDDPVDVIQAPAAPTGLTVSASGTSGARVTWAAVSDADGYVVERATGAAGTFASIATPAAGATSYDDAGLAASTTYRYRVFAVRGTARSAASSEATYAPGTSGPRMRVVTGNITANQSWTADTTYVVSGFVKVVEPARLTIAAGTRIVGDSAVAGSALFILQGAQIDARGTAAQPIVFTSQRAVGVRQPGDWGGLVIVGRGVINRSGRVLVEGTTQSTTSEVNYGGGTSNGDDSGTLQYVRVEFAGYPVLPNAELNSFTFAAVGSGTTVDHLQAMAGLDDSFEWFGGAVDAKYLVSYEAGDDHFDASEGYRGRNQFLIAYQDTILRARAGLSGGPSSDPQAFEVDGCSGTGCDLGAASAPYTVPVFANFTLVGTGSAVISGQGGGVGIVLRRGAGGVYLNGVIARFPGRAISIQNEFTDTLRMRDSLQLRNILLAQNGSNFDPLGTNFGQASRFATANIDSTSATATSLFVALPAANPASAAALDWTPSAASALRTGGLAVFPAALSARLGTFILPTTYRGAVDPNGPRWWDGWTVYTRR